MRFSAGYREIRSVDPAASAVVQDYKRVGQGCSFVEEVGSENVVDFDAFPAHSWTGLTRGLVADHSYVAAALCRASAAASVALGDPFVVATADFPVADHKVLADY